MQWEGKEEGGDVEDRRGLHPGVAVGGGVGALVIMALVYFLGIDPQQAQQVVNQIGQQPGEAKPIHDRYNQFSNTIFAMTDKVWTEQVPEYKELKDKDQIEVLAVGEAVNLEGGEFERLRSVKVRVYLPQADIVARPGIKAEPGRRVVLCSECR